VARPQPCRLTHPWPHGSAALHARHAAEHELNRAGTNRPYWCTWPSEEDLAVDTGQTLLDLGDARPAHQLLTRGEQLLPTARDKTRGVFQAYQAASRLTHRASNPPRIEPTGHAATATPRPRPSCPRTALRTTRSAPTPAFRPYAHHHAVGRLLHLTGNAFTS
jgi:hypothetical protein